METPVISKPFLTDSDNNCNYKVSFEAKDACPVFSTNSMWVFLEDYLWLWGILFMLIGVFLCFWGRKLFVYAIFLITAFAACLILMLVFYALFLKDNTAIWVGWIVLCVQPQLASHLATA